MTVPESELLRAICAVLHCPLPPLYGGVRPLLVPEAEDQAV
jgi:hypothetical protein